MATVGDKFCETSNHALQRTASRSDVITTLNAQPGALPPAVAELVSR
jgi:hypothetical protein